MDVCIMEMHGAQGIILAVVLIVTYVVRLVQILVYQEQLVLNLDMGLAIAIGLQVLLDKHLL